MELNKCNPGPAALQQKHWLFSDDLSKWKLERMGPSNILIRTWCWIIISVLTSCSKWELKVATAITAVAGKFTQLQLISLLWILWQKLDCGWYNPCILVSEMFGSTVVTWNRQAAGWWQLKDSVCMHSSHVINCNDCVIIPHENSYQVKIFTFTITDFTYHVSCFYSHIIRHVSICIWEI